MNAGDPPASGLPDTSDPWILLGLEPTADARTIKRAYVALIRRFRPEDDPEAFKRIRNAFEQATRMAGEPRRGADAADVAETREGPEHRVQPVRDASIDSAASPVPAAHRTSPVRDVLPDAAASPVRAPVPPERDAAPPSADHPRADTRHAPTTAPPWTAATRPSTMVRAIQARIVHDDATSLWAWLDGETPRGFEPADQTDPSHLVLALAYLAWRDPDRAERTYGARVGLHALAPHDEEHWRHTLEAARALRTIPTLERDAPRWSQALRCATPTPPDAPTFDLRPLHEDVVQRPDFYAGLLDRIERTHPVLLPWIERIVNRTTSPPPEASPALDHHILQTLEAAQRQVQTDPLRIVGILVAIVTVGATVLAAPQIGWWAAAIPTTVLVIAAAIVYFGLEALTLRSYRQHIRPSMLRLAATTGADSRVIALVVQRESDPDDTDTADFVRFALDEDYAVGWFSALYRARYGRAMG